MRRAVARVRSATAAVSDSVIVARSPLKARMTVRPLASVVMNSRSPSPSAAATSGVRELQRRLRAGLRRAVEVFVDTVKTLPENGR